jgi:hypothetical protein
MRVLDIKALIHNNPSAWQALSQAERDRHDADADEFLKMVTESGELELLQTLDQDPSVAGHHRLHAVRAHLLEMGGDRAAARAGFQAAARRTTSLPEQRYLEAQAARLADEQ